MMNSSPVLSFGSLERNGLLAIIESSRHPICAIDLDGNYLIFNEAYKIMMKNLYDLGVHQNLEKEGRHIYGDDERAINQGLQKALEGRNFSLKTELGNPQIKRCWYELNFNPVWQNDVVVGVTIFSQDISEQIKLELEHRAAKEAAQADANAKSAFLSNMSHEIRTPMNAILGLTELLLQKKLEENALENLRAIHYSANNLLTIINDILDFSKIEAGKLSFDSQTFDLFKLLEEINKSMKLSAQAKNLLYEVQISAATPQFLRGDAVRLSQILINLLGNSIKFTNNGKIKLVVEVPEETNSEVSLQFLIQDSGIGIPKDQLQTIFQSFTQVQNNRRFKVQGTGLGLSITKRLVEMQNGHIGVESELGKGSLFRFSIPYPKSSQKEFISSSKLEQDEMTQFPEMKVLLVEDNKINQLLAKQILTNWNIGVEVANDGFEAIAKLQRRTFDLVLLDLQMPEIDGFEVTKFIRKALKAPFNQIPIVALTADAYFETRVLTQEAGMNDFLTKPYQQKDLFRVIGKYSGKQTQMAKTEEFPVLDDLYSEKQTLDFEYINQKFGKDRETFRFILEVFINEIGEEIVTARKLLDDNEGLKATKLVHKLVSTFSAMGMKDTAFTLSLMERMLKQEDSIVEVQQKLSQVEAQYIKAVQQIEPVLEGLK